LAAVNAVRRTPGLSMMGMVYSQNGRFSSSRPIFASAA
jgi:hypothetical protein